MDGFDIGAEALSPDDVCVVLGASDRAIAITTVDSIKTSDES
jgi:hypothetical protein